MPFLITPQVDDYALRVSRGLVPGVMAIGKTGRNLDVDIASAPEDIWTRGGDWIPPTDARIHDIVSTDVGDAAAGVGARTIRIYGIGNLYELQTEDIILSGTTNVPTVLAYRSITRLEVLTAGTLTAAPQNIGTITATAQADGTVTAEVAPLRGRTEMAIDTIPAEKTMFLSFVHGSIRRATAPAGAMTDFDFLVQERINLPNPAWVVRYSVGLGVGGSPFSINLNPYLAIPGPAHIKARVTLATDDDETVSSGWFGYLVDD